MNQNTLPKIAQNLPVDGLDAYIQQIYTIPMLSEDEEMGLAEKYQQFQDINAAQTLVMSHLRYVVKVARSYSGYGLPLGDLIQEGTVGLMKAVKKFQPHRGARLVTLVVMQYQDVVVSDL